MTMHLTDSLPEAVQWTEGMLLSPQHFQQQDIYWQSQLWHFWTLHQPYGWGVGKLLFDPSALAQSVLRVTFLHAVTPDGLVVQFPGLHESSLELDLSKLDWPQSGTQRISLAVARRERGAATPGSAIQRFDCVPGALESDETLSESTVEVGRLRPRLMLLAGSVAPRFTSVPLLEVFRDSVGSIRVGAYFPPALCLTAGEFLEEMDPIRRVRKVVEVIRTKLRDLTGSRLPQDNAMRLSEEAQRALAVARGLAMTLPSVELMIADSTTHPQTLYLELSRLVGHLAILATNPTPPVLRPYRHEDLRIGLGEMLDFLDSRLALINPMYEAMLFERESDYRFSRPVPQHFAGDQFILELRPRPGQDAQSLTRWLEQATVGSDEFVPELKRRRLPGVHCAGIPVRDLPELNVSGDAVLFRVTASRLDLNGKSISTLSAGGRVVIEHSARLQGPSDIVWHQVVNPVSEVPRHA